ncbi:rhomboid family intramembrane serine protease [Mucilaginibacter sp. HD30]
MHNLLIYQLTGGAPVSALLLLTIIISTIYGLYHPGYFLKLILHPFGIVKHKEYYRLFTAELIHNDFAHLLMNAWMYYVVCINLEQSLNQQSFYGSGQFFLIYLLSYLTGVIVITLRHRNDFNYSSAGASGSIMGCMMSFMLLKPDKVAFYLPVYGGVKNSMMALLFIVVLTVYQYRTNNPLMNNELHFYSALGGIVGTVALFPGLIF